MIEEEAQEWIVDRFGDAVHTRLAQFAALVTAENDAQNLIAPSTVVTIWSRHIVDSAQLRLLAPGQVAHWLDVGTGGGFPGIVCALLIDGRTTLVEPRKRRVEFLRAAVDVLGIGDRVGVEQRKVENVDTEADVISARAVSTIENLLRGAMHCATHGTRWLLPRGQVTAAEMSALRSRWKGVFHVEHSITAVDSMIVTIDGAARR